MVDFTLSVMHIRNVQAEFIFESLQVSENMDACDITLGHLYDDEYQLHVELKIKNYEECERSHVWPMGHTLRFTSDSFLILKMRVNGEAFVYMI